MPELHELERFSATLRQLPLPPTLENPQRLERFKMALLSGVESLYRDRKKPFLGELQRRLKSSELWSNNELRAGAAVCALDASRYFLVPPFASEPPCVLLRKPPPGFDEWYGNMPTGCMMASLEEEETRSLERSIGFVRMKTMRKVIDSFYKDAIEPNLPEVQERLRSRGWSYAEAQQAVLLFACQPNIYEVRKPTSKKPIVVLLKEPPMDFTGWCDGIDVAPKASPDLEVGLKYLLAAGLAPTLRGGVAGAAFALQEKCQRGLGELRAVLRVFLKKGLLRYDGDELLPSEVLEKELQQIQASPRTPKRRNARIYSQI